MSRIKEELERRQEQRTEDWYEFFEEYMYDGTGNPIAAVSKQMSRPKVSHYKKGKIQPIDYINSNQLNFNLGNVIKYVTRCNHKGTKKEDLLKAIDYINFELESM
jgi:hypothetical protein